MRNLLDMTRSSALLLAGAVIGILGSVLVGQFGFSRLLVFLLLAASFGLVVFGTRTDLAILHQYRLGARRRRKRPKIGILNDMEWGSEFGRVSTWTDISPSEWQYEIDQRASGKGVKLPVELMGTSSDFDPYAVIVNPYGGTYPERDLISFQTLNKIFQYVQDGGVFVNVADIPGYWAYHPMLGKRTETAPPIFDFETEGNERRLRVVRPFSVVPWMKRLGLNVLAVETVFREPADFLFDVRFQPVTGSRISGVCLQRAAMVDENMEAVHKVTVLDEAGQHRELASMFWVTYSEGSFLISLVSLSGQPKTVKDELRKALASLILSKLV